MSNHRDTLLTNPVVTDLGSVIGADNFRLVGGCVRDALLGELPHDLDACTSLVPSEILRRLSKTQKFDAHPTGIEHGTITAVHAKSKKSIEVTTLRRDVVTDGRHAKVEFGTSWREDAARRDFTINALMLDLKGGVYDFFDGEEDLRAGRIRFIGEPNARLSEDWLRALRYFRFWARYGKEYPNEATIQALSNAALNISKISVERIWAELKALAGTSRFWDALNLFEELGFSDALGLTLAWPINRPNQSELKPSQVWGALLGGGPSLKRLRASRVEQAAAANMLSALDQRTWFEKQALFGQDAAAAAHIWSGGDGNLPLIPAFPVKAEDLFSIGLVQGPELGKMLAALKKRWIVSEGQDSREDLLEWCKTSIM